MASAQAGTLSGSFDNASPVVFVLACAVRAPHVRPARNAPRKPHCWRRGARAEGGHSQRLREKSSAQRRGASCGCCPSSQPSLRPVAPSRAAQSIHTWLSTLCHIVSEVQGGPTVPSARPLSRQRLCTTVALGIPPLVLAALAPAVRRTLMSEFLASGSTSSPTMLVVALVAPSYSASAAPRRSGAASAAKHLLYRCGVPRSASAARRSILARVQAREWPTLVNRVCGGGYRPRSGGARTRSTT